jgi:hypothetical protein
MIVLYNERLYPEGINLDTIEHNDEFNDKYVKDDEDDKDDLDKDNHEDDVELYYSKNGL